MKDISAVISDPTRHDCFVIGEVAQAHDGSLGTAHAYIDAIADAGADAVKFQTHIADAESTPFEPWRVRFSDQDETRFDYWKRMEFTDDQWAGLKKHADERELVFLSSPFSIEAVEMLDRIGMQAWKIASGEIDDAPMLERIYETKRPVIFSTGMSTLEEIENVVGDARRRGIDVCVLQCTTEYPTAADHVGLAEIPRMRERLRCAVGLSDHSGTIFAGIAAAAVGIDVLEVHVALSRQSFGPDVAASVTAEELKQLVKGVRFAEQATQPTYDRSETVDALQEVRKVFAKSIVAARDLPEGTSLGPQDLAVRKAGGGLPPSMLEELFGKKLVRSVPQNEPLSEEDVR